MQWDIIKIINKKNNNFIAIILQVQAFPYRIIQNKSYKFSFKILENNYEAPVFFNQQEDSQKSISEQDEPINTVKNNDYKQQQLGNKLQYLQQNEINNQKGLILQSPEYSERQQFNFETNEGFLKKKNSNLFPQINSEQESLQNETHTQQLGIALGCCNSDYIMENKDKVLNKQNKKQFVIISQDLDISNYEDSLQMSIGDIIEVQINYGKQFMEVLYINQTTQKYCINQKELLQLQQPQEYLPCLALKNPNIAIQFEPHKNSVILQNKDYNNQTDGLKIACWPRPLIQSGKYRFSFTVKQKNYVQKYTKQVLNFKSEKELKKTNIFKEKVTQVIESQSQNQKLKLQKFSSDIKNIHLESSQASVDDDKQAVDSEIIPFTIGLTQSSLKTSLNNKSQQQQQNRKSKANNMTDSKRNSQYSNKQYKQQVDLKQKIASYEHFQMIENFDQYELFLVDLNAQISTHNVYMIGNDYLISDSIDPNNIYNEVNMKINEGDTILCEVNINNEYSYIQYVNTNTSQSYTQQIEVDEEDPFYPSVGLGTDQYEIVFNDDLVQLKFDFNEGEKFIMDVHQLKGDNDYTEIRLASKNMNIHSPNYFEFKTIIHERIENLMVCAVLQENFDHMEITDLQADQIKDVIPKCLNNNPQLKFFRFVYGEIFISETEKLNQQKMKMNQELELKYAQLQKLLQKQGGGNSKEIEQMKLQLEKEIEEKEKAMLGKNKEFEEQNILFYQLLYMIKYIFSQAHKKSLINKEKNLQPKINKIFKIQKIQISSQKIKLISKIIYLNKKKFQNFYNRVEDLELKLEEENEFKAKLQEEMDNNIENLKNQVNETKTEYDEAKNMY
ncbi:hypothetical protein PPERSA_04210 [Pseudocohnilembus persalinus]|uniref:Uncharacterized protein n=1 Tax=Pseudocohnilembus persalinus TaxID=266149 RepID=A0A0V0QNI0_PSEPJ|nr:hypothetical protein PPERSA_04210 [Pseudocohnilembus persalinus]|eukprot:KRX03658.1 hypothetical protein PPERSA_04210 [Pseudocohnilembus persalinus]